MGGLDALTFTAGIGENDEFVRQHLLDRLAYMGIKYDHEKNLIVRNPDPRIISTEDSSIPVIVYPTNEELAIARQALTLI